MYLLRLFPIEDDDSYELVCLMKDESLGMITLYVEPTLIHHTKDLQKYEANLG
jgi:hypothetical protein